VDFLIGGESPVQFEAREIGEIFRTIPPGKYHVINQVQNIMSTLEEKQTQVRVSRLALLGPNLITFLTQYFHLFSSQSFVVLCFSPALYYIA